MQVAGLAEASSAHILGVVSLLASAPGAQLQLSSPPSVFHSLHAHADSLVVGTDLSTSTGPLSLLGGGSALASAMTLNSSATLSAGQALNLSSTRGIVALGALHLKAGTGVSILDNMTSAIRGSGKLSTASSGRHSTASSGKLSTASSGRHSTALGVHSAYP